MTRPGGLTALLALLGALIWFGFGGSRDGGMRRFDPDEVARLETAMWRSYYAGERVRLFAQAASLLRSQYGLPPARALASAFRAARAAFIFKEGSRRADYERALPSLVSFYRAIRARSDTPFDVERAARLELEWWIVHRERARGRPGDLVQALADLPAELYRVPVEGLKEHARLRAEAMTIRDERAAAGGVGEGDWKRIEDLLLASWRSLHTAVGAAAQEPPSASFNGRP
jgi:hypothetical protein